MGKMILFWLRRQPDPNVPTDQWTNYLDTVAAALIVVAALFAALIVVLYQRSAMRKLIGRESDPFRPYTPMHWLWLALAPAVIMFTFAWYFFVQSFPDVTVGFTGPAAVIGVIAGAVTFIVSFLIIPVPGITPAKFKYRPLRLFSVTKP